MAYFEQTSPHTYQPTTHVGGAWQEDEQHIAPSLGLITHVVEQHRDARRDDALALTRLSFDIWGVVPLEEVSIEVEVLRPGRTIELVQATMRHGKKTIVTMRAWLQQSQDTAEISGTTLDPLPAPDDVPAWDVANVWPGGFIRSVEVRRAQTEPGRAVVWARPKQPLVADQEVSRLARAVGMFDLMNGLTVREDPRAVAFPNLDLTAHVLREPAGEWLGYDLRVSFDSAGVGLTHCVLHDENGPLGTASQILTVRPL